MEAITIVMPIYNAGVYLRPCIESILAQTFTDFRLLAIDDGSTDGSLEVIQEFAALDERVVLMQNRENIGAAKTRNRGIDVARGKYLAILDADDYYEKRFLQRYYNAAETAQADIVFGNMVIHDMQTGEKTIPQKPKDIIAEMVKGFCPKNFGNVLFQICFVGPTTKLIKRNHIEKYQLRFQDLPNSNDVYFGLITLALANKAVYIDEPLVNYRDNQKNNISAKRGKNPKCIFEAAKLVQEELQARGCFDLFKITYYSYVINNILWTMNCADDDMRKDMTIFMQQSGLQQLGMNNLQEHDFLQADDYKIYCELLEAKMKIDEPAVKDDLYEMLPFLDVILLHGLRSLYNSKYNEAFYYLSKWYHLRSTYYETSQTIILHYLSQACYGLKRYNEALDYEEEYFRYAVRDEDAWLHFGNIKYRLEDYKGAVEAYAKAIDLQAEFHEAIVNLCLSLIKMGLTEDAKSFQINDDICRDVKAGRLLEYRQYDLEIGDKIECWDFPIFINARDRFESLKNLVAWLQEAGYRHIYILDNASTYTPLLAYYQSLDKVGSVTVYRLSQNYGHTALWDSGILELLHIRTPYVYTDPDIIPSDNCPKNIVDRCYQLLKKNQFCVKVGMGIEYNDLKFEAAAEKEAWEKQFYRIPIGDEAYFAPLDTTFALYRNIRHYTFYTSIRTTGSAMIRHLPWYYTKGNLPDDEKYYMQYVNSSSTQWWNG